jgi:hypothetical protein
MIARKFYRYSMSRFPGRSRLVLLGLASLLGCASAPPFASRRLADGSYELTCKLPLSQCLDRVDQVCDGTPYDVLSAHDHRRPIDIPVGSYQREVRSSDAIIRCERSKPLFGGNAERNDQAQAPVAPPTPAPAKPPVCVPGATQACVGAAACAGGQACLPDGAGFGPCSCGPAAGAADGGVN